MIKAREYVRAQSLEEAYRLNQKKSSVIVGGMMWLKMTDMRKAAIIDLSALGLDQIEETETEFRIGCMCSLRQLETHPGLNGYFNGIFKECTRHIVGIQFRNGATVGGSIFGRYGFSDILTCMLALDADVELYAGGRVCLSEFNDMSRDRDILVRVIIRKDGRQAAYVSQRRSATDFPLIACAAARLEHTWYFSVGARPMRARLIQMEDPGTAVSAVCERMPALEAMAEQAASQYIYGTNSRAGGEYRSHLAAVYLKRLVRQLEGGES